MILAPSNKLIAHLDMNSYFASVEQQANPALRGKALGVCAYLHESGCIIAASIEAKKQGMKVGMTVREARLQVPGAVFVENDAAKYRAVTSKVFSLLRELTDKVEHYSIDEAFLDLTGWYRDAAEASWALTRVRARIKNEIGDWLRCSIGIAPTRFLAKTASDFKKPNGLTIIDRENLDSILVQLQLEDICGIAKKTRRRLERLGIMTLIQMKNHPIGNLMHEFGMNGYFWWCKLNAIEFEDVVMAETAMPKSIGHSYCVPKQTNREGKVLPVLMRLTERAGSRMRKLGLRASLIYVSVGFANGPEKRGSFWQPQVGSGLHIRFPEPVDDSFSLLGAASQLFQDIWTNEQVNFLSVTFSDLSSPTNQIRFNDAAISYCNTQERRIRASRAADAIRDRYGSAVIVYGDMMRLNKEAPDRIGFRKVEGLEMQ